MRVNCLSGTVPAVGSEDRHDTKEKDHLLHSPAVPDSTCSVLGMPLGHWSLATFCTMFNRYLSTCRARLHTLPGALHSLLGGQGLVTSRLSPILTRPCMIRPYSTNAAMLRVPLALECTFFLARRTSCFGPRSLLMCHLLCCLQTHSFISTKAVALHCILCLARRASCSGVRAWCTPASPQSQEMWCCGPPCR